MSHPLAVFGLEPDADERALKRAYAQKLKSVRPDEDAEGFQKLNEAYKLALAFLRSGELPKATFGPGEDDADEAANVSEPAAESPPPDRSPAGQPYRGSFDAEEQGLHSADELTFRLDLRQFVGEIAAAAQPGDPDLFRSWLQQCINGWPLGVKSDVGSRIMSLVIERRVAMRPVLFDILVEELGVDEVTAGMNPLVLQQYRQLLIDTLWADQTLSLPMHASTKPRRDLRSVLFRWPVIWLLVIAAIVGASSVVTVMSGGDQMPPPSEVSEASGPTPINVYVNPGPGVDDHALQLMVRSGDLDPERRIDIYDEVIGRLKWMTDVPNDRLLALAFYNKGKALEEEFRFNQAQDVYATLQKRMARSPDEGVALLVAASYMQSGQRYYDLNQLDKALNDFRSVIDLYGLVNDGQLGLQVAKAMVAEIDVLMRQKKLADANSALERMDQLFAGTRDPAVQRMSRAIGKIVQEGTSPE